MAVQRQEEGCQGPGCPRQHSFPSASLQLEPITLMRQENELSTRPPRSAARLCSAPRQMFLLFPETAFPRLLTPPKRDWRWNAQGSDSPAFGSIVGLLTNVLFCCILPLPGIPGPAVCLGGEMGYSSALLGPSPITPVCINTWDYEPWTVEEQSCMFCSIPPSAGFQGRPERSWDLPLPLPQHESLELVSQTPLHSQS